MILILFICYFMPYDSLKSYNQTLMKLQHQELSKVRFTVPAALLRM